MNVRNIELDPRKKGKDKIILSSTVPRRIKLAWQIFTKWHCPIVRDIKIQKTQDYLGAAKRWIDFPEDESIVFPAEVFLPKVQMKYDVGPKLLPRNVEMERRRRAYKDLKIENALEAEGVKPCDMLPPERIYPLLSYEEKYDLYSKANYLPLEVFDDEEFDCRTAEEWMNFGIVDGVRYPLPAMIFVEEIMHKNQRIFGRNDKTLNDLFGWIRAAVLDYNSEKKVWTVLTLDGLKRKFLLPRIYIRFYAEDPRKFAQRVAAAVKQRQIAEATIKYHFYLDCMRVDGMPALDEEQQKARIILLASQQGSIERVPDYLSSLMDEIMLEYRRVMCNLMWRSLIEKQPDMFNFIAWVEINNVRDITVPEVGKVHTDMEDFAKTKDYFHCMTLYVLPEVHEAMQCVVAECIHVSGMNLFAWNYGKSMPLLEFESQQNLETGVMMKYLKESWLERIAQSVRMCLRNLENGWLDLEQKNHEIYVTKLKRFMDVAVLQMQTALRNLVYKSIAFYVEVLTAPAKCILDVNEDFVWGTDLINTQFKSSAHPVFNIDILINDETVYYSTDLESFEEVIITLLDNSLSQCHQVKQLHCVLLPSLEFANDLFVSSVDLIEKQVCEARDRLRIAYRKSVILLKAYANEYRQYLDFFTLDVDKYMKNFKDADHTAMEVKDEVSFHLKMKSAFEKAVPNEIIIGPFRVNVQPLRSLLVRKRQNCSTQLLTMFAESLRARIDVVLIDYSRIIVRLRSPSRDIEHLFEEQDWVTTIPLAMIPLDETVQKLTREFDVLDYFWRNLSDQDFEAKWQAIGSSRQVRLLIEKSTQRFAGEYEKFYKLQIQDEILLTEKIDILMGNVANMTLQTDIDKIHETAIEVKRIGKMIKEYQESALLLNKRQELFDMKVVVFDQLDELMKKFEPYLTLWITASDWLKWQEVWMENPLINIDAHQIEGTVADLQETMSRCAEILQDNPKVAAVAFGMRSQIEAFKPYIGMIQALLEMKGHHFEELLKKTGVQMVLTPTLTFKNLLVLGVMEFKDIVVAIADAARRDIL